MEIRAAHLDLMGGLLGLWLQVLKEVKEEEEEMVDSNKRWNTQVNSNKR